MDDRIIQPTDGIEAFVNKLFSITLQQYRQDCGEVNRVVIELRDVETVRQWLAELLVEAQEEQPHGRHTDRPPQA